MSTTDANAYLRTRVLTASPEELRLMLLEGAIRFLRQGRDALHNKAWEPAYQGITRARDIVFELLTTAKPEPDRELYNRVAGVYTFMYAQLVEANLERDPVRCDKVLELLEYERETWTMLMGKLAEERSRQTADENRRAASVTPGDGLVDVRSGSSNYTPLSIQG